MYLSEHRISLLASLSIPLTPPEPPSPSRIPYDVLWLDIEHTDGKRYLTWDRSKFPDPEDMQRALAESGRKTVVIVDPHLKADPAWDVYKQAVERGVLMRGRDGGVFVGDCWPGER